eukprot:gene17471-biopygen2330
MISWCLRLRRQIKKKHFPHTPCIGPSPPPEPVARARSLPPQTVTVSQLPCFAWNWEKRVDNARAQRRLAVTTYMLGRLERRRSMTTSACGTATTPSARQEVGKDQGDALNITIPFPNHHSRTSPNLVIFPHPGH